MRRGQNGQLTGRGKPFPPDPDAVDDLLDKLVASRHFDASLLSPITPEELLANRLHMKIALARYARVDPFSWEHRPVGEMREHFEAMLDLMKDEGAARQATEGG